eukprot:1303298-Rhodomonas_salina.3
MLLTDARANVNASDAQVRLPRRRSSLPLACSCGVLEARRALSLLLLRSLRTCGVAHAPSFTCSPLRLLFLSSPRSASFLPSLPFTLLSSVASSLVRSLTRALFSAGTHAAHVGVRMAAGASGVAAGGGAGGHQRQKQRRAASRG